MVNNNIVESESDVTILNNIVENYEQCWPNNNSVDDRLPLREWINNERSKCMISHQTISQYFTLSHPLGENCIGIPGRKIADVNKPLMSNVY